MAFALVLAVFLPVFWSAAALSQDGLQREPLALKTSTGTHAFKVEIARTGQQKSRGLMYRRALGEREGMLFIHEEPELVTMWMRNTYIPLDMVFIRADGRVHRIEARTEPHSERVIVSGERVTGVLEIPGGVAAEIRLKPGDLVHHPHFGTGGG